MLSKHNRLLLGTLYGFLTSEKLKKMKINPTHSRSWNLDFVPLNSHTTPMKQATHSELTHTHAQINPK